MTYVTIMSHGSEIGSVGVLTAISVHFIHYHQ